MLKKAKNFLVKSKQNIERIFFTISMILISSVPVLAGSDINEPISGVEAKAVEGRLFGSTKKVIMAFGGASVGIGLALVAFKMILCHKKQEARTESMESLIWIGGGAVVLGAIAILTGFFWGTFGLSS